MNDQLLDHYYHEDENYLDTVEDEFDGHDSDYDEFCHECGKVDWLCKCNDEPFCNECHKDGQDCRCWDQ